MNFKLKLCVLIITSFLVQIFFPIHIFAYEPPQPFSDYGFVKKDGNEVSSEYMDVWKKKSMKKDFTVEKSHNLRIENDGELIITNGATLELKGNIFIERGAVLKIKNGTLKICGGNLENCGTIIIEKAGQLRFQYGRLNSTAAGSIANTGKITCVSSIENLNDFFNRIKKYDENFNLTDYSLLITSKFGSNVDVILNYCIEDVQTNYTYKFTIDVSKDKTKIVRKAYSIETVYSADTKNEILNRVSKFEKSYASDPNFINGFWKNYGYLYNYKTNGLTYEETWFFYDNVDDVMCENTYSAKL